MTPLPLALWVRSVAIAAAVTSFMLAVLIVAAEEVPSIKNWLTSTFYHHWLAKGALALVLFAGLSMVMHAQRGSSNLSKYIFAEALVVSISIGIISGFFLLHALGFV